MTMVGFLALTAENHSSLKVSRSMRPPVDRSRTVRKKSTSVTAVSKVRCAIVSVPTGIHNTDLIGSTARLHIGNPHEQCPMNVAGGSHAGPSRNVAAVDERLCLVNADEGDLFIFHSSEADVLLSIGNPLLHPEPDYSPIPDNNDSPGTYPTIVYRCSFSHMCDSV